MASIVGRAVWHGGVALTSTKISMNMKTGIARPAVDLPVISRETVRQLVEEDATYLREASLAGLNIHQVSLDRIDQIHTYMAGLNDSDKQFFSKLFEEETNASTQAILDKTKEINANIASFQMKNLTRASDIWIWISIIIFFISLISIIRINR